MCATIFPIATDIIAFHNFYTIKQTNIILKNISTKFQKRKRLITSI